MVDVTWERYAHQEHFIFCKRLFTEHAGPDVGTVKDFRLSEGAGQPGMSG